MDASAPQHAGISATHTGTACLSICSLSHQPCSAEEAGRFHPETGRGKRCSCLAASSAACHAGMRPHKLRAVPLQSVESKLGRTGEGEMAERETGERREEEGPFVQGGKTFCASFCASLIVGSRRAFLLPVATASQLPVCVRLFVCLSLRD